MKKIVLNSLLTASILLATAIFSGINAQDPPPPPPPNGGQGGNQAGGAAPLGSGIALLLTLGAGYGAKKVYNFRKEK
jgi:hypothetical protein